MNKVGDYLLELNKIYNMDCLEFMKDLPDNCVDLIIADSPYYKTYGEFDFIFKNEKEYLQWTDEWVKEANRILIGRYVIGVCPQCKAEIDFTDCSKW